MVKVTLILLPNRCQKMPQSAFTQQIILVRSYQILGTCTIINRFTYLNALKVNFSGFLWRGGGTCTHARSDARGQLCVLYLWNHQPCFCETYSLIGFCETYSLIGLGLADWLSRQSSRTRNLLFFFPVLGLQTNTYAQLFCTWILRMELKSSCFLAQ